MSTFRTRRAFSLVELLVVIGLIVILMGILVPSLFAVRGAGARVLSMKNLAEIGKWNQLYSQENRDFICPSKFNYVDNAPFQGKIKSQDNDPNEHFRGTWTDILWTQYADTAVPGAVSDIGHDYSLDSPDDTLYRKMSDFDDSPFRAAANNSRGPNQSLPGYFAANNFFDADPASATFNGWWTRAQILDPARSLYAIDSMAGETIDPVAGKWGIDLTNTPPTRDTEVDYRYEGEALILFLDGHVEGESEIIRETAVDPTDIEILENERKVRVRNLNSR